MHGGVLCWVLCQAVQTGLCYPTTALCVGAVIGLASRSRRSDNVILCCEQWVCGTSWAGDVERLLACKHTPASRRGGEEPRARTGCPAETWWAVGG